MKKQIGDLTCIVAMGAVLVGLFVYVIPALGVRVAAEWQDHQSGGEVMR